MHILKQITEDLKREVARTRKEIMEKRKQRSPESAEVERKHYAGRVRRTH